MTGTTTNSGLTGPTAVAVTAKAFMECVSGAAYQRAIENVATLGGWVGAREAGLWDTRVSDAVAKAAVAAVMDLFRGWAAECGEAPGRGGADICSDVRDTQRRIEAGEIADTWAP